MEFQPSEEQEALRDLSRTVFADHATHDRLTELEASSGPVFDERLWSSLADAGVLEVTVPAARGGTGLTLLELLPVLEAAGEHVAPVPLVPTLVTGVGPLARFGDDELQARWLPRVAAGDVIATAALEGDDVPAGPGPVTAARDGSGWRLAGQRAHVPYAAQADLLLVPATSDGATGVFVVEPGAGVDVTEVASTNGAPIGHLGLDGTPAQALVPPGHGDDALGWMRQRGAAAWCAVQAGVCEGALRLMAQHASTRHQFGRPIGEFQAVSQRAADAFIDTQMVRLTAWQAVFRLAMGWEATTEVHTAKFWAGDGAMRVVHAAQHVHGGLGVDTSHPLHRYFLWAKQVEHTLGTPTRELVRLGGVLADSPV